MDRIKRRAMKIPFSAACGLVWYFWLSQLGQFPLQTPSAMHLLPADIVVLTAQTVLPTAASGWTVLPHAECR